MIPNGPQAQIMSLWEAHLRKKSRNDYRKILATDEGMSAAATEFYALLPVNLQGHVDLQSWIDGSLEHRHKTMSKAKSQKKTFGRVIKKDSADFSDVDLSEFGL